MKTSILMLVFGLLSAFNVLGDTYIYPTLPGTYTEDFSQSPIVIEDNGSAYHAIPGTNIRDLEKPEYIPMETDSDSWFNDDNEE